jgi:hypothetical protein
MTPLTYTREQLAAMLALPLDQAARRLRELARDHDFPRPLPGLKEAWSARAVRDWIEARPLPANDDQPDELDEDRQELEKAYGRRTEQHAPSRV